MSRFRFETVESGISDVNMTSDSGTAQQVIHDFISTNNYDAALQFQGMIQHLEHIPTFNVFSRTAHDLSSVLFFTCLIVCPDKCFRIWA
jgi:hypothetical protein